MRIEKLAVEHVRAALRTEEKQLKELLDAIELNDATFGTILYQITRIEDGLKRIRYAAS